MTTVALRGVIPPMITPLTPSGALDEPGITQLANHMIEQGVNGIFVLGTSGEGPWLTAQQRRRVVELTVEAANGRVPVLAGSLEASTSRVLEDVAMQADSGADAIVATVPYYYMATEAMMRKHFRDIADASALPLVMYNIPPHTHTSTTPALVRELAGHENVIGLKDSAGDEADFTAYLSVRNDHAGFAVLQGYERKAADALIAGADGIVPGLGNVVPGIFAGIAAAVAAGEHATAHSLQAQVDTLWRLHTFNVSLACLKYAASLLGFGSGAMCGGHHPLSDADKAGVRQIVEAHVV